MVCFTKPTKPLESLLWKRAGALKKSKASDWLNHLFIAVVVSNVQTVVFRCSHTSTTPSKLAKQGTGMFAIVVGMCYRERRVIHRFIAVIHHLGFDRTLSGIGFKSEQGTGCQRPATTPPTQKTTSRQK